jgi:hypothetical protein
MSSVVILGYFANRDEARRAGLFRVMGPEARGL